jgi:hypothetical protein
MNILRIRRTFLKGIILLIGISSCSNNLDLVAPDDPLPIVYFIMNPSDSIFYLTLTKRFAGKESAFDLAQDPQKVYYHQANIRLEGWSNQFKTWETSFKQNNIAKGPGIFPEFPGYCYESPNEFFPLDLNGNLPFNYDQITSFRLVIDLDGMFSPTFSTIPLIPMPKRIIPATPLKILDLYPDGSNYKVQFKINPTFVAHCELICVFRFQVLQGIWLHHTEVIPLVKNVPILNDTASAYLYCEPFFNKIAARIKPINDTILRRFESLDLIFLVGDKNFYDYTNSYINSGDLDIPPVSNISQGHGLFSMVRSVPVEKNMTMSYRTLEYLANSELTKQLGFIPWF